jgi:hypothetical protein
MTTSVTAIWIICAVVVAGLLIWLASVALAARKPYQEHAHSPANQRRRASPEHDRRKHHS